MFWCRGRLQREKQLSLLKTLTLPTFSKLTATLPKKSLAAKTNFGRILPKIFGTANFYFDFFSAFRFVLQRVTLKLNKSHQQQPTQHPAHATQFSTQNKCYHRQPSRQSTGEKLIGLPFTI